MGSGNVGQRARLETAEVCNRGQRGRFNSRGPGRQRHTEKWSLAPRESRKKGAMKDGEVKRIGFLLCFESRHFKTKTLSVCPAELLVLRPQPVR